jgi:hypothetical protein
VVVEFNGTVALEALQKSSSRFNLDGVGRTLSESCITSLGVKDELKQLDERDNKSQNEYTRKTWAGSNEFEQKDKAEAAAQGLRAYDAQALVGERKKKREAEASTVREQDMAAIAQARASIDSKIAECSKKIPVPVKFQFNLSADKTTFKIGYMDDKVFGEASDHVLALIYQ